MKNNYSEKPLIGFVTVFRDFGEVYPLVTIAKKYIDLGGRAIFFGYGTGYENLARDIGCKTIKFTQDLSEKGLKRATAAQKKLLENQMHPETFFTHMIHKDFYQSDIIAVEKEVKAFKDTDVKMIVASGLDYLINISARVAKIPLVYIVSGAYIPPYYQQNLGKFPDNYENFLTRLVPGFIKNRLANWYIFNNKSSVKEFNRLAHAYNTPRINHFLELFLGDYMLVAEDITFLNLKPTADLPSKNFVGPIFQEKIAVNNEDSTELSVKKHLERPGKSLFVSLGSSGTKKLFLEILRAFEKTDINVVAVYATVFNKDEIPTFKDNILPIKFVPSIKKLNESVDIAVIHGGRGTIYTAAYAGKPVIGIPMQLEQQCNIDNLVRHGSAIRLSKRNFTTKNLLKAVDKIFINYDTFFKNAQLLKEKLQEPKGAENTVKRLLEIVENDTR